MLTEKQEQNSTISKLLLYLFIFITIGNLIYLIKFELNHYSVHSFQFHLLFVEKPGENKQVIYNLTQERNKSIQDLKNSSDIGWYNLSDCSPDYKYGLDLVFLCFQYMIVPTILENNGFNKKIICYYTSPEQLDKFCQKKKKYKVINKDIFTHFALLERED
jgi:hypothetical protein